MQVSIVHMYVGVPEDDFLLTPQPPPFGVRLNDEQCHALAYRTAFAGLGHVSPNPLVGCVITDAQGHLLAVGAHRRYGEVHAEAEAIAQALARGGAQCLRGSRVYVTLQPCTHHGKTPPCSELLLRHGVREVHFGADDPNPRVGSLAKLQQAGISCHKYAHPELQWLDEAYFFHAARERENKRPANEAELESGKKLASGAEPRIRTDPQQRPFVAAKIVAGLDGSYAAQELESGKKLAEHKPRLRISCERALQYGHFLRQRYDAILVGAGTLRLDDPRLNVRAKFPQQRSPWRVVLADAEVLRTELRVLASEPHTVIVVVPDTEAKRAKALLPSPATLLPLPRQADGKFSISQLLQVLYREHSIHSLLLEGGGQLWASFFAAGLVDKLHLFQSPCTHTQVRRWSVAPAMSLHNVRLLPLASDWVAEGQVDRH